MNIGHMIANERPATGLTMVCGFAFIQEGPEVLLIHKPSKWWDGNRWNGLGGKVEKGESYRSAMARYTMAQSCVATVPGDWQGFHCQRFKNGNIVHYMATVLKQDADKEVKKTTHPVFITPFRQGSDFWDMFGAPGLTWLLPMAYNFLALPLEERWL